MSESDFILHGPKREVPKLKASLGEYFFQELSSRDANQTALLTEDGGTVKLLTNGNLLHYGKLMSLIYEEHGMKSGDTVMIAVGNTLDFAPVAYGAFFSGIACSPVNPAADTSDFLHLLTVIHPQLVLCDEQSYRCVLEAASKSDTLVPVITLEVLRRRLKMSASTEGFKLAQVTDYANHVALVMCSSGTTGRPKGVEISQEVLSVMYLGIKVKAPPNSMGLSMSGPYWASGTIYQTAFVMGGTSFVLLKQFEEKTFLELIIKYNVSFTSIGPDQVTALAKWADTDKYDLPSLWLIAVAGSRPTPTMVQIAERRLKKKLTLAYGMTESFSALELPTGVENKDGTVGTVATNASVKVVDPETGKILGPNTEGEICLKSRGMLLRYRGNPEATAALLDKDGYIKSGDIGYYDDDGYFYIVDRIKDLIKYKLNHVAACDIEEVILQHSGVKDAVVIGIPNVVDTEHSTAFVIKAQGSNITAEEIISLVEGKLPKLKWLHGGVVFVDSFPRTASGKVQKRIMRATHLANLAKGNQDA